MSQSVKMAGRYLYKSAGIHTKVNDSESWMINIKKRRKREVSNVNSLMRSLKGSEMDRIKKDIIERCSDRRNLMEASKKNNLKEFGLAEMMDE